MAEQRAPRYYGYSQTMGRMRLLRTDGSPITDEAEAILWAAEVGADNVVREEGPISKPTSTTVLWERAPHARQKEAETDAHSLVIAQQVLAAHMPYLPVKKIGVMARAVVDALKER